MRKARKEEAKKLIARMIKLAQKAFGEVRRDTSLDPLETVLMLQLAEGSTPERAARARRALEEEYVDLNEVRVSPPSQIAEVIAGVTDEENKAFGIKRFLERLFNHQHCIDFSFFTELSSQGARAYLEEIESVPRHVVDSVMMCFYSEGVLPVDANIVRVVHRVGLIGRMRPMDAEGRLRELVLKRQVLTFHELTSRIAHDNCLLSVKHCERCPLAPVCETAKALKRKPKAKKAKAAPREAKKSRKKAAKKKASKKAPGKAKPRKTAKAKKSSGRKTARKSAKSVKSKRAAKSR